MGTGSQRRCLNQLQLLWQIPWTGWLEQQTFISNSTGGWSPRSGCLHSWALCEGPLPGSGLTWPFFGVCTGSRERERVKERGVGGERERERDQVSSFFYEDTNPITGTPSLWLHLTLISTPTPKSHQLQIPSHWDLGLRMNSVEAHVFSL